MQFLKNRLNFLHSGFSLFLAICATFSRKNICQKRQFYMTASFEKQLKTAHKQKKSFAYFNNELTKVANSSFCISKNKLFWQIFFSKTIFTM